MSVQIHDRQASFSKDAVLSTTYQDDYITRGKCFQIKKRITLTTEQVLYLEFDITKHDGLVYSLPLNIGTAGGLVFIDSYNATSSTGGSVLAVALNQNGLSSTAAKTTVKTGVTVSGTTSNVREYIAGTSSTNQSSGVGGKPSIGPKILDNTKPLYFKIENKESDTVYLDLEFVWYEL